MITTLLTLIGQALPVIYRFIPVMLLAIILLTGTSFLRYHPRFRKLGLLGTALSIIMSGIIFVFLKREIRHIFYPTTQQTIYVSHEGDTTSTPKAQTNITVKNNIERNMLKYKHWSGTYEPSTFVIQVNEKKIEPGTQKSIPMIDGIIEVRFDYAFLNGKRKGAKIIVFEVDNDIVDVNITFNWKNKWQVLIDNAKPVEEKKAKFNTTLL